MARPFAVLGFSVYGALLLAALGGPPAAGAALWVCVTAALCLGAVKWNKHRRHAPPAGVLAERAPLFSTACLLMAAALAFFLYQYGTLVEPAQKWAGQKCTIKARVLDYPEPRYHRYYYRLRVEEVDKTTVKPFTIRLSASVPLYCQPYDWVECPVSFYAFDTEGLYSQRSLRLAGGCQLGAYLAGGGGVRIPCGETSPGRALALLRKGLSRRFSQLLPPEDAGLMQAMLLGDRDSLPEGAYEDFRLIGCAHLLVVSGLHMGAVAGLTALLMRRTHLRPLPRTLLSAAVLLAYLFVTGFPVSGVRAFIMCAAHLLGGCLGRRADGVNSLGLALLLICLQDPFSGGDLSLALSAFATLGILTLSPAIRRFLLRPLESRPRAKALLSPAAACLSVTLSVTAFTVPWQILAFQGISLLSPLANLLLAAPCTLLLYCALLTLLFSLLPGLAPLARPFAFCAGWLSRPARSLAGSLAAVPRAYVHLGPVQAVLLLGALFILLALCLPKAGRLRMRAAAGLMALFLTVFSCWQAHRTQGFAYVALYGAGDNACIAILQGQEAAVLQTGAREGSCISMLRRSQAGRVATLFLPQDGASQRLCARQVTAAFPTAQVLLPPGAYIGRDLSPEATGASVSFLPPGGRFQALPGIEAAYQEDGSLRFTIHGAAFSLEPTASGPILRVKQGSLSESFENSSFTVLLADDIIDVSADRPLAQELLAGRYAGPPPSGGLRLAVSPAGHVTVQEGS